MLDRYNAIVALTDDVCTRVLNDEYRALARSMTAALCRKRPSPLQSGPEKSWACGIVQVLGSVNFLGDKASAPYLTTAQLCAAFDVGQSTSAARARVIKDALNTGQLDPNWSLPSMLARNPLVWMAQVNGIMVDLRHMPREVQEIAYHQGIIPYIPADQ